LNFIDTRVKATPLTIAHPSIERGWGYIRRGLCR